MMKFCYVDESGVPLEDDWFFLSGFILDIRDAMRLDEEIDAALDLDWREQFQMETLKDLRKGSVFEVERRNNLSDDLYEHLNEVMDYQVCSVIFYQPELDKLDEPEQVYITAFKFLLERFQFLLGRDRELGSVYNDTHQLSSELQEAHHHLQKKGSDFIDFDNIAGISAPISDELSRGIQMADLVTSGIRAHFLDIESRYYTDHILPHMYCDPRTGDIMGAGIKAFPNGCEKQLAYHPNKESF